MKKFHLLESFSRCYFHKSFGFERYTGRFCYYSSTKLNLNSSTQNPPSFHKRPLPNNLIALSSSEGKRIFREALDEGGMESFFPLAEQFVTQSEPSYCSLSTLAMVLNALDYDPKKVWRQPWRWVSEEMLQCDTKAVCGHSLEKVKKHGLNFNEFESLARCHGVKIISKRACHSRHEECGNVSMQEFQKLVEDICSTDKAKTFVVSNYSRKYLKQTGDGHFSPIAGYHRKENLALVLDVARFKYPPYWVKMEDLWESMSVIDAATGKSRGYFIISTWETNGNEQGECPSFIQKWDSISGKTAPCDHQHNSTDTHHDHNHSHHHDHTQACDSSSHAKKN